MSQAVAHTSQQVPNLTPTDLPTAFRLADMMANASLVPKHLQGHPADCLLVIEQAVRWGMSPFAVAQATSVIQGKLMYEGKLVAAAINSSGLLSDRLAYDFTGNGDTRTVTVKGTIRGETKAREAAVTLRDVRTENGVWKKQPDQQLVYSGTRVWARRHAPEVMLGIFSPDEFDEPQAHSESLPVAPPPAAGPTEVEWLEKIIFAADIDELGQVSQAISKARLADDVLANLRGAFIKRKVELTPTSQPQPAPIDEPEHDPDTGEILAAPGLDPRTQGAPPASEAPAPASETAPSDESAQQPTRAEYLAYCRDMINARSPDELRAWWSEQAAARKRFRLSPAEESDLKASIKARIKDAEAEATQ